MGFFAWLLAAPALTLGLSQAQASNHEQELSCFSGGGYAECDAGVTIANAHIIQQISHVQPDGTGDCIFGQSWGFYGSTFWVNHMCSAAFGYTAANAPAPTPTPCPTPTPTPCPNPTPVPPPPPHAGLSCERVPGGGDFYFPVSNGRTIGLPGSGGYYPRSQCLDALNAAASVGSNVVCSWTGVGFMPYSVRTTTVLGQAGGGFIDAPVCDGVVRSARKGLICSWKEQSWYPYVIDTTHAVPGGFADQMSCLNEVNNSQHGLACARNANGLYQPYHFSSERLMGVQNYGWQTIDGCRQTVAMSTSHHVCNWNGVGYQPYTLSSNSAVGTVSYPDLASCYASVP